VERTTPFARIFVFPAVSAMRLPITPWADASSPGSSPADVVGLKVSPSHLSPRHSLSSRLAHARSFLDRATPNHKFAGRVASKTESHSQATTSPNPVPSEEEKSYELSNMLL
jgi:hypothetical protein